MSPSDQRPLDVESRLAEGSSPHRDELRLWLRLLSCTNLVEGEIRRRLRQEFDMTLARFDLMAQIERAPNGILLGELSRRLMVSNGNVTGLVERLAQEGLVTRVVDPGDRRAARVSLTPDGRTLFARMAKAHGDWLAEMLQGLDPARQTDLWRELGAFKTSVRTAMRSKDAAGVDTGP